MPVQILPSEWVATNAYSTDDVVQHSGVRFVAKSDQIANSASPIGNDANWEYDGVLRITDFYSLQYSIEEALNTQDATVRNSIPSFIELAERYIGKLLRSPGQLEERIFTVDADSKFAIPFDMLAVNHMRRNNEESSYDLLSRGSISIIRAPDRESFEELQQYYTNTGPFYQNTSEYSYPYWRSDNEYFHIAPAYDDGDEIALQYYQAVPLLGTSATQVNDDYEPLNADGQTEAQFVAGGGEAADFVEEELITTTNLWTATQPHLLKAAAMVEALRFLNDPQLSAAWTEQFKSQLAAAEAEFSQFEASGPQGLQQESAYC